jgi:hypothetical protein
VMVPSTRAHSSLNLLHGLLGVWHEFRQDRINDRHQRRDDPRDRGLGDTPQITKKLLCPIVPQIHAGDLDRPVQSACFGRPIFLFHGAGKAAATRATSSCICESINPVVR